MTPDTAGEYDILQWMRTLVSFEMFDLPEVKAIPTSCLAVTATATVIGRRPWTLWATPFRRPANTRTPTEESLWGRGMPPLRASNSQKVDRKYIALLWSGARHSPTLTGTMPQLMSSRLGSVPRN
jgi:hypothetical protein